MPFGWTPALPDRIGVCHASGRYTVGPEDQLTAGAKRILELGSRVVKLWFRAPPSRSFPFTPADQWPEVHTLVDLANAPLMRGVFDLPFTSIFLSCDAIGVPNTWSRPQTDDELAAEAEQFEALTRHLLATYAERDLTFVVQNWEGDWAVRGSTNPVDPPRPGALDGMIVRLNNRQAAIERGRAGSTSRARVLQAVEVNLVFGGEHPHLAVTKTVLPDAPVDLYSYSAWETACFDEGVRLPEALETIRAHVQPSDAFGRDNVCIGEFGAQEVYLGKDEAAAITRRTLDAAIEFGCPYAVYWEIFDNETMKHPIDGTDYPGFWVLRPDGSRSVQGDVLAEYLAR